MINIWISTLERMLTIRNGFDFYCTQFEVTRFKETNLSFRVVQKSLTFKLLSRKSVTR